MFSIFKIKGCSLYPVLEEGDYVLILKKFFRLKENDIVIFRHHKYGILIKKVQKILPENKLFVVGTDINSIDSRKFGEIDKSCIIGKVIFKIKWISKI